MPELVLNPFAFEQWLGANRPELWEEWELEASHLLDVDEWIQHEHWQVWDEWRKHLAAVEEDDG